MKNHSRDLHSPLSGEFIPNLINIARTLQKYLQQQGCPVKTACTLKEARASIQEEMPLVICCDLDLPDEEVMKYQSRRLFKNNAIGIWVLAGESIKKYIN